MKSPLRNVSDNTLRRTLLVSVGWLAGALLTTSCSSDGPTTVDGLRDDLKQAAAVREVYHIATQARTKTECASRNANGKCTSYRTVGDGTKRVKVVDKPGKPALYCVELDDVNGSKSDDDVWYTVSLSTYVKVSASDEGAAVKDMSYLHAGCWR